MLWLAIILALGIGSQWLAWWLRLPSILVLLLTGFLVGPVARWATPLLFGASYSINPNAWVDSTVLLQLVSLSVGLILFEGGLTLNFREITGVRSVVFALVTIGAAITWAIGTVAGKYLLGLNWNLAVLLGAVLIVTGPTVIGPLLRHIRPSGKSGRVLRWEGIIIDPIGAMAAVLAFEAISSGAAKHAVAATASGMLNGALATVLFGTTIGVVAALVLAFLIYRFWVPDYLQVPMVLMVVTLVFAGSNTIVHESGLFSVTVMGMVLANQRKAAVRHIVEFKETLTVVLIAVLFIVLSARVELSTLKQLSPWSALFVLAMVVVARPLSVFISCAGSALSWSERIFIAWMAPRGIVAAAVASVFALRLRAQGVEGARLLVPYVFLVIVCTVALYGLTAGWVARRVGVARVGNSGFLIIGADLLGREIGQALLKENVEVLLVDTNLGSVSEARLAGLPAIAGNALSGQVAERIELSGIGRLIALTSNDDLNALATVHYARLFGRAAAFQLAERARREHGLTKQKAHHELTGRTLFGTDMNYEELLRRLANGGKIRKTPLTSKFDFSTYQKQYGGSAVPMFLVSETGDVTPFTSDASPTRKAGQSVIGLVQPQASADKSANGAASDPTAPPRATG